MRKIRQYVRERQYIMHFCAKTTVQCDGLQRIYSTLSEGVERGFGGPAPEILFLRQLVKNLNKRSRLYVIVKIWKLGRQFMHCYL